MRRVVLVTFLAIALAGLAGCQKPRFEIGVEAAERADYAAARVRKRIAGDSTLLHLHAGYLAALVALALHSFTDFGLHLAANAALLSVIVGVVVGLEGGKREFVG